MPIKNTYAHLLSEAELEHFQEQTATEDQDSKFFKRAKPGDYYLRLKNDNELIAVVMPYPPTTEPLTIEFQFSDTGMVDSKTGSTVSSLSEHIMTILTINSLKPQEKSYYLSNPEHAWKLLLEEYKVAGNFFLVPSSKGPDYLTACIREWDGTITKFRYRFANGFFYDESGMQINSIRNDLEHHTHQTKINLLNAEEGTKKKLPATLYSSKRSFHACSGFER